MKIFILNSLYNEKLFASITTACRFYQSVIEIYTDHQLSISLEHVRVNHLNIFENLQNIDEPVLLANLSTVFTAESLNECYSAYEHFSVSNDILLQLTFDNELLQYPEPTVIHYGGRRLWSSRRRITGINPVLYGNSKTILKFLNKESNLFNDGIFHSGNTTILNPIPPLAFNLENELPVQISSAAFNAEEYIRSIPAISN